VSTSTVPPTNQTTSFETQMIPMTPQVLRRTLREDDLLDIATAEGRESFWCLKFNLSLVFSAYKRAPRRAQPMEPGGQLSLVNRNVWAQLQDELDAEQFKELHEILHRPVGAAFNLERWEQLLGEIRSDTTILHFFGHGKDGALDLGEDQIDVIRFKMMYEKLNGRGNSGSQRSNLLFLNACDSMTGDGGSSFREAAASRPGLSGLIATEAAVPRNFAAKFGLSLMKSLLIDGNSIGSTMHKLRRDPELWPLSLLYSCYAPASYQIGMGSHNT
jgi:hypothetical protein